MKRGSCIGNRKTEDYLRSSFPSHPKRGFAAAATEVRPRSLRRPQSGRGAIMEAPLAHLFLSAPSRGQSPKEAERGGVTEGAVIAVTTVTVVRQEAASGRGRSRQRRVGRDGHDGLALANRSWRDQVIPPAGLGVTRAVAAAAAACRVAVDDEAFSGEVPVNFCSAAAAASHSAPFRFG